MSLFIAFWATVLGLAVGSFLNVVIYRVPRSMSLSSPGSHCPRCQTPIKNRHNVPVLGWLMLRGRCHTCRLPISARYPLVEAGTALGFAAVSYRIGPSLALPAYLYLMAVAITLTMIAYDSLALPDSIVLPSYLVAALLLLPAGAASGDNWAAGRGVFAMFAMVAIYFALTLVYPAGSGLGDVKVAGLLGLYLGFLGWQFVVIGTVGGVLLGVRAGQHDPLPRPEQRHRHQPHRQFRSGDHHRRAARPVRHPADVELVRLASHQRLAPHPSSGGFMAHATLTGLDIGSASIRAVEVALAKDGPVIHSFGSVPLPEGAVVAGVMMDDKAVTAGLRELWTSHKFSNRDVVLGVTNQQVVVREIEVTNLPPKEMRQALPFQVRDVLPIPVEKAILDFYPLEYPGTKATVRGLLIAAPKDAVLQAVRAVEAANLHVTRVDLSSFAALRAAAHVSEVAEAMIDIGARTTNIVVHVDGAPQIVRTVPRGGDDITALMAARLGLEPGQAEVLKRQNGLFNLGSPEVADAVAEGIRPLISEVRSSLAYYPTVRPNDSVERIALVGGGSQLPGLVDELANKLRVHVYLSDPLQRVEDSRHGGRHDVLGIHRASAAVCDRPHPRSGVMTTVVEPEPAVELPGATLGFVSVFANLLPDEIVDAGTGCKLRKIIAGALVFVVVLVAALAYLARSGTSSAQTNLNNVQSQGLVLLHEQAQYTPVVTAQSRSAAIERQLSALMSGDVDWPKLLTAINAAAPTGVTVTGLTGNVSTTAAGAASSTGGASVLTKTPSDQIGTVALSGTGTDPTQIAAYLDALSKVAGISVPYPAGVSAQDGGGYTFTANLLITTQARGGRYSTQTTGGH